MFECFCNCWTLNPQIVENGFSVSPLLNLGDPKFVKSITCGCHDIHEISRSRGGNVKCTHASLDVNWSAEPSRRCPTLSRRKTTLVTVDKINKLQETCQFWHKKTALGECHFSSLKSPCVHPPHSKAIKYQSNFCTDRKCGWTIHSAKNKWPIIAVGTRFAW